MGNNVIHDAFLVAKYLPDLERMEPQNIGVILWSGGRVATRFASSDSLGSGVDEENYARWIEYWERLASGSRIQLGSRSAVTVKTIRFLRELQRAQRGNYVLEEGGGILDPIDNIEQAAEFLFARLVTNRSGSVDKRPVVDNLKNDCEAVLREAGLASSEHFVSNVAVPLQYGSVSKELRFHYAMATNGHPKALFLRVRIDHEPSLTSAVGKFASASKNLKYPKKHLVALYVDPEIDEHRDSVVFLKEWSEAVNIASSNAAGKLAHKFVA